MKGKVHVILKKEELLAKKLEGKTVVIFDVLLATSTIAAALQQGAIEVIPVKNEEEALKKAETYKPDEIALVGEYRGKTIEGFFDPNPSTLKEHVQNKAVILSTTNGTVAIHNAEKAKHVYAAYEHSPVEILKRSAVGEMLTQYGFLDEIGFVSRKNVYSVVPKVVKKKLVNGEETICLK